MGFRTGCVLFQDGHKCFHCGKADMPFNAPHLESRKTGGDSPSDLITLYGKCHSLSEKAQKNWKLPKRVPPHRDAALMGIMRRAVCGTRKEPYADVTMTQGYVTKDTRIRPGLEKTHVDDAYCIAGNLSAKPPGTVLKQKKVRHRNRQVYRVNTLEGGRRNQAPHGMHGFRLFGKVLHGTQTCLVAGGRQERTLHAQSTGRNCGSQGRKGIRP